MQYRGSTYGTGWDTYFFEKNLQGDIVAVYNRSGTKLVTYKYDAWGNTTVSYLNSGGSTSAAKNPFTYRGYYYDSELQLYYLNSRYYDPAIGRFISPDSYVSTGQGLLGYNMYAYCGNNPVMRIDPVGEDWYHWLIGAAIVVACGVATVVTCGGFAAAASAVVAVSSGIAATTVAATVATGAFIGSSIAYGSAVFMAMATSHTIDEFKEQGDWGTVVTTALGGFVGAGYGYDIARTQISKSTEQHVISGTSKAPKHGAVPNSRYIQYDQSTGQIRSDVVYNANGDWYSRIDYMHTHNIGGVGYKPHIHFSAPLNQYGQPIGREIVIPW